MSNGPDAASWRSHCTAIPVSILSSASHEAADHGTAAAATGGSTLRERDYIGLSDSNSSANASSVQTSTSSSVNAKDQLEPKASYKPAGTSYAVQVCRDTELRLGIGPNSETSSNNESPQSGASHETTMAVGNGGTGDTGIITSEQQLQQKVTQQQQVPYSYMSAVGLTEKGMQAAVDTAGLEDQQQKMQLMQRAIDTRFPFRHAQADQAGKDTMIQPGSSMSSRMMMMMTEGSRFAIPVPKVNNCSTNHIVAGNNSMGSNNAHHLSGSNSSTVPAKRTYNEAALLCDNSSSTARVMATSCSSTDPRGSGCMGPPAHHHHHHHHHASTSSSHTPPPPWNKSEASAPAAATAGGWHMAYHYSPAPLPQQHTQSTFASASLHHHPLHAEAQHLQQQQRQMLLLQQQQQHLHHHHHHHHPLNTASILASVLPPRPLSSPPAAPIIAPAAPLNAAGPTSSCSSFPQSPSHEYNSEVAPAALPTTSTNSSRKAHPAADAGSANDDTGSKARVVGWPPIRSFRKHTLAAANSQPSLEKLPPPAPLPPKYGSVDPPNPPPAASPDHDHHHQHNNYVKAKLDGVRICRKVDLRSYDSYNSLKSALQDMFQGFVQGNGDNSKLDLIHGHDFVLTYEDKDGDLMFVGDLQWEDFAMSTVKSLRIVKSSGATGFGVHTNDSTKVNSEANIMK